MPRKKKSKDPEEGACPLCRKLVPLTPTRGGSFVLRTHHVVVNDMGYGVKECEGSLCEPAALDDSKDWAWVPPEATREASEPTALGEAIRAAAAEVRAASDSFAGPGEVMRETLAGLPEGHIDISGVDEEYVLTTEQMADVPINGDAVRAAMTTSTVPEALRPSRVDFTDAVMSVQINEAPSMPLAQRRTAMRHAARCLRDALEAVIADVTGQRRSVYITPEPDGRGGAQLRGHIQPDGFQFATHIPAPVLADQAALDDLIRRATAEARTQLERRFRPSSADVFGADGTMPQPEAAPDFTATVLEALRQAWIDETGEPPRDATVTLEPDLIRDLQVMNIVFEPYALFVNIPIYGDAPDTPGFAGIAGRAAAASMRGLLRERLETRCTARDALHECDQPVGEHDHRCRICNWLWRDPATPSLNAYGA